MIITMPCQALSFSTSLPAGRNLGVGGTCHLLHSACLSGAGGLMAATLNAGAKALALNKYGHNTAHGGTPHSLSALSILPLWTVASAIICRMFRLPACRLPLPLLNAMVYPIGRERRTNYRNIS